MNMPEKFVPPFKEQQVGSFSVCLASTDSEIEASQELRHAIFCGEMGASLHGSRDGRDIDEFDRHCQHLIVTDCETGQLAGSTRLLFNEGARAAGMFYSESEFDLDTVLALSGRIMEVGRTCIHPDYRTGTAIRALWNGIAQQVVQHDIDYLIGCASLPMDGNGGHAQAIVDRLRDKYFTPQELRVTPRQSLPETTPLPKNASLVLPALLKAYLRLGAKVGGEACWDPDFNVADVFIFLHRDRLAPRYSRTFLECA
jgi:putative hemolysin